MKRLDFYYRSHEAIEQAFRGLNEISETKIKSMVNFFVLKSAVYKSFVDSGTVVSVNDVPKLLEDEKIPVQTVLKTVVKVMSHWLFLIPSKLTSNLFKAKYKYVLKTYVEVEYELFKEKVLGQPHLLLIFPFPLSLSRQRRFLSTLKAQSPKQQMSYSLYGMPYSPRHLLNLLLKRNLYSIFLLEYEAAVKFGENLKRIEFNSFKTMDDFDPLSIVYNDILQSSGYYVDTHLHGIGTYSPFISTDHLRTFNRLQQGYYTKYANITELSFYEGFVIKPSDDILCRKVDAVVFYSQLMVNTFQLAQVEERVINQLKKLAKSNNVELYYKKHPNFTGDTLAYLKDVKLLSDYENEITSVNTVGASFYSTSYYTENHTYSILIKIPEIPVHLLFSQDHMVICESKLEIFLRGNNAEIPIV